MLEFYVKVFRISLLLNYMMDLVPIWCHDRYHPRSCQGQGHRLRIFMLKFYVEIFSISLLLNYMIDLVPICYHHITGQKVLCAPSALMTLTLWSTSQT